MIRSRHYHTSPLALALAGAIGATIGLLFAPKRGEEMRGDIMHRAQDLAVKFRKSREDIQDALRNIFGEVSEELERDYIQLRAMIMAQIDELQEGSDLTKDRYSDLVSRAVKTFSKGKSWTKDTIQSLKQHFEDEWDDVRSRMAS